MLDQEKIIDLYEQGYTIYDIAEKYNVEESAVKDALRDYLIEKYEEDNNS